MARRLKKAVSRGAGTASRSGSRQKTASRRGETQAKASSGGPRKLSKKAAPARKSDKGKSPAIGGRAKPIAPAGKAAKHPAADRKAGGIPLASAGGVKQALAPASAPRTVPSPVRVRTSLIRPPAPPAKPSGAEEERLKKAREIKQAEEKQAEQYGKAVKLFNSRRFDQALALFKEVSDGPHPTLRHRAQVHAKICQQQEANKVLLKTAEEFYNYGIKLMNERSLDEADRHLKSALKLEPKAGHIHFARAVLGALRGDRERSYESLKKAVELDPHNRYLARNDADLAGVRNDPAIAALLHEEGSST
jgi:hypothetical protein